MTTDPALIERMEKLVREMAPNAGTGPHGMKGNHYSEAYSIAALLSDKDMEAARVIRKAAFASDNGSQPADWIDTAIVNGIKHGRANP